MQQYSPNPAPCGLPPPRYLPKKQPKMPDPLEWRLLEDIEALVKEEREKHLVYALPADGSNIKKYETVRAYIISIRDSKAPPLISLGLLGGLPFSSLPDDFFIRHSPVTEETWRQYLERRERTE